MPIELCLEPLVSHRTAQTEILKRIILRAMCDAYEKTFLLLLNGNLPPPPPKKAVQLILHIKTEFDVFPLAL